MRTLVYTVPHQLGKLHEELLDAIPELRPVPNPDADEVNTEPLAVMTVSGDGETLTLGVPDTFTDDAAVQAVVDAHEPTPPMRGVAAAAFAVVDAAGNVIFRIDDDGSLHGLAGKDITFDL